MKITKPIKNTLIISLVIYTLYTLWTPIITLRNSKNDVSDYEFNNKDISKHYDLESINSNEKEIITLRLKNKSCTKVIDTIIYANYRSHHTGIIGDDGYQIVKIDDEVYLNNEGSCGNLLIRIEKEKLLSDPKTNLKAYLIKRKYRKQDDL